MTLRNGQWSNRPDPMYDHSHESINLGPNVSHKRKPLRERWWFILAEWGIVLAALLIILHEQGCFDK